MSGKQVRAAIYLRVSRDGQTTENQRLVLVQVAEHPGWIIAQTYQDQGISGAKGLEQRPAFDQMLKDAVRRRFVYLAFSKNWLCDFPLDSHMKCRTAFPLRVINKLHAARRTCVAHRGEHVQDV